MIKYIILDFGMVLAYPTTGNWHITPKFLELIDINKIDKEKLKNAIINNKEILDRNNKVEECSYKKITKLEELLKIIDEI